MRSVWGVSWSGAGLGVGMALVGMLLLGVTPAVAGIGGSVTPTWPGTATVGDLISTSVIIINESTFPNETENVEITNLVVTPACADSAIPICLGGNADPGVFKVLTAVGDAGTTPCAGTTFTVGAPDLTNGAVQLTPATAITLGPATGPVASRTCQVNMQLRVFKVPSNPAIPPATTDPLAQVALRGVTSNLNSFPGGAAQITIAKGPATVQTTANPPTDNIMPGTAVTDTATVSHAPGAIAPTGSVRFILCQPDQVTATGCDAGTGTVVPPDKPLVGGSATSDASTDTTAQGKYCWRARYLGDANYEPSNHTDATGECFTTLAFRISVIVCTAEATPRFHSSGVTLDGSGSVPPGSTSTGDPNELCKAAANFNDLPPGLESLGVTINQNDPNTP